ncbi:MAG: N-acetyltransferase [Erysipelotrichales bacterium]
MIRKAREDELEEILDIWLVTNIKTHDFIEESYWQSNLDYVRKELPKADLFVFDREGEIAGFIGIVEGFIGGIFIAEKWQSKGIGKQLLDYSKEKYDSLTLEVYAKNLKAYLFYLNNGFEVIEKSTYDPVSEEEYTMKWEKDKTIIKAED